MSLSVSIAAVVMAATAFVSPELDHFPGDFFNTTAKPNLQRRAMERWPGPEQIVELWASGTLEHRQKMAVLLGASAYHDSVLLPLYREALSSPNSRLRMAAAYGYRDLLGDALPNVAAGIDEGSSRQLAGEIDAVGRTLRVHTLTEFWLAAALAGEGRSMPGFRGVVMRRGSGTCLKAVEKVLVFEDFPSLAKAYRITGRPNTRAGLLRLLEAVTLQKFYTKPNDSTTGWGLRNMNEAVEAADRFLDHWVDRRCVSDVSVILKSSLANMGAHGVDPFGPDSWELWLRVLKKGTPGWRMMASRRLYELGGRWSNLSMFQSESEAQTKVREGLFGWYRLYPATAVNRNGR